MTDGQDLDAARDVLERVLASDRADVPATTQRRLLAEMDSRPVARPPRRAVRCPTPSWFADLHGDVSQQLNTARHNLREERESADALHGRLDAAKRELAEAERAMEPFRPAVDAAESVVKHAQAERWAAHSDLRRVGRIKRPAARREANKADDALNVAQGKRDEAVALAAPTKERVDACRNEFRGIEASMATLRILKGWTGHEARHAELIDIDCALTTWHRWATGESVTDTDLGQAVRTLCSVCNEDRQHELAVLVDGVNGWAEHARPELVPQLTIERRTPRPEIGIGL